MPRIVLNCGRCGQQFSRPHYRIRVRTKSYFCSQACGRKSRLPDNPIIDGRKVCRQCGILKEVDKFHLLSIDKPATRCKSCISSYQRNFRNDPANIEIVRQRELKQIQTSRRWWQNLPFEKKQEMYERERGRRWALRLEVLTLYGGQCACCGESNPKFLTFDHSNNDGSKDRYKKGGGYRYGRNVQGWILKLKREYPVLGIQVLCWNCNCARQVNSGLCPHGDREQTVPLPLQALQQLKVLH